MSVDVTNQVSWTMRLLDVCVPLKEPAMALRERMLRVIDLYIEGAATDTLCEDDRAYCARQIEDMKAMVDNLNQIIAQCHVAEAQQADYAQRIGASMKEPTH